MITRINVLINVNLKLLYNSKSNSLNLKDFKDDFGNKFQDSETFARIMQKKELITPNLNEESCYILTKIGKQVYENGGWLEHLKNLKEVKNKTVKIEPKKKYSLLKVGLKKFFGLQINKVMPKTTVKN
jgi:hypothetical protein